MHFIVKVLYKDSNSFETVCISHNKKVAMDAAEFYSNLQSTSMVEVYRESLIERVKCEV